MSTSRHPSAHSVLQDGADRVTEVVDKTVHAGADAAQQAMDTVNSAAKQLTKKAAAAKDTITEFIEERPLTSVFIALGVGALLARLLHRR